MDSKKLIFIIVIVLILMAGGVGLWYWPSRKMAIPDEVSPEQKSSEGGIGAQIFEKTQNPIKDRTPETNPFSADTNPFDAKTNPFQDEYKNPFK